MAKKSVPLVDYYQKFNLDRNKSAKELTTQLRSMQGDRMKQATIDPYNYELQAKVNKDVRAIEAAIKIFEHDKDQYDKELAKAYEAGKVAQEVRQAPQGFFSELDAMLNVGNYSMIIERCNESLSNNVKDVRLYHYLAMANYGSGNVVGAFDIITTALTEYHDDFFLLRLGARYSANVRAFGYAQGYVDRLLEVYPENPLASSDQCYLYEQMGKEERAFKLINDYLEKNPNSTEFRQACSYDLVTLSHSCYIEDSSSGSMIIATQEKYEKCLATCNKAAEIYKDDMTTAVLESAQFFGKTEYNWENFRHTLALFLGSLIYGVLGLTFFLQHGTNPGAGLFITLGAFLLYSGIRLIQVSFRPYWQINKFYMTGKRERSEQFYIWVGNVFAFYLKWSIKIAIAITVMVFVLCRELLRQRD